MFFFNALFNTVQLLDLWIITHEYLLEAVGHGQDGDTHNTVAQVYHWANG